MIQAQTKLTKVYPLLISDGADGAFEKIAWIDMKGNYHVKKGKKRRVVEILMDYASNYIIIRKKFS